jgi:hypothetical protein
MMRRPLRNYLKTSLKGAFDKGQGDQALLSLGG